MNKGLEVIEAVELFEVPLERIEVVIHPQSVIHSMVEMVDGSVIAQMGITDMKHPIQYALTYPERQPSCLPPLDLAAIGSLTFEEPDAERFPCLGLAFEVLKIGGTMPAILNAANEIAVDAFLEGRIGFGDIATINRGVMNGHSAQPASGIGTLQAADKRAREAARKLAAEVSKTAIAA
jgi:1-deoxy-D-xylulose-5-phosphate reductoisomerase